MDYATATDAELLAAMGALHMVNGAGDSLQAYRDAKDEMERRYPGTLAAMHEANPNAGYFSVIASFRHVAGF